jgi:hypothetical protein
MSYVQLKPVNVIILGHWYYLPFINLDNVSSVEAAECDHFGVLVPFTFYKLRQRKFNGSRLM